MDLLVFAPPKPRLFQRELHRPGMRSSNSSAIPLWMRRVRGDWARRDAW